MGAALEKLTAEARESIARGLFTVEGEPKTDKEGNIELAGLCPIHGESNASFSYNITKDVYHCLACGAGGDLIDLFCKINRMDGKEGFKAFCVKYGIGMGNKEAGASAPAVGQEALPAKKDLEETYAMFPKLSDEWIKKLEAARGWSAEEIEKQDIRLQTHYQCKKTGRLIHIAKPARIAMPIRDDKGVLRNIRLYMPEAGKNDIKIISWGKGLGDSRLFPPAPDIGEGAVLLCEGEGDMLCARSNGFNAITQTSKTKNWEHGHREKFRDRDVVIAYDADLAGQEYARWAAKSLAPVARRIRMLEWPDYMGRQEDGAWPEKHGQDLTDFFVRHKKTADALQVMINEAREHEFERADLKGIASEFFERGANDRMSFKSRLLAERVMRDLDIMYDPKTELCYRWNGQYFVEYDEDYLSNVCLRYLGDEAQKSRVMDAVFQVKMLSTIPHGREVNDKGDWVCIKNGMLNLKTLDKHAHDKDFYATNQLGVFYDPESEKRCDRWLSYLETNIKTPEVIMQIQEFFGYCLTRECKFEKALLMIGPGSDGKSTMLKILRKLVGTENCSAVNFMDLEDQFQRSALYNKLVNISTEIGSKALESQYFKGITSGDPISAAYKHVDVFEFTPYCKLVFATNKLPKMLDNSDGYFRRLLPIKFKRQFLEDDPDRDVNLEHKLEKELSEIFEWAIVGLHRLWEQGRFTDCVETQRQILDYRRLNNPVVCFLEDCCELSDDLSTPKVEIWQSYKKYCNDNGYKPKHRDNFFVELYAAENSLKRTRPDVEGKRIYSVDGVGLKPEAVVSSGDPPAP